jgi:hypothetical protein
MALMDGSNDGILKIRQLQEGRNLNHTVNIR